MKEGGNYVAANGKDNFQIGGMDQEGDSDDSKDSDAIQLFELPKRKLVRPISSSLRRKVRPPNRCWSTTKECCRVFVTVTLPMLIAVFIVSTILCLTFLLVGIAGMKQEISVLKIRLKNVDAAERNFIGKKEQLRRQFQNKLNEIISYQTELLKMKSLVNHLSHRLRTLNASVHRLHSKPTSLVASKLAVLKHDIDTLKNGMADTGADIEKLKATGTQLGKDVISLNTNMEKTTHKIYNLTVQMSQLENKPAPPLVTTPKTLVVTLTPDLDKPPTRREVKVMFATFEKKQFDACKKEVSVYDSKLADLVNETMLMNKTYSNEIGYLRHLFVTQKVTPKATEKPSTNTTIPSTQSDNSTITIPISSSDHTAVHEGSLNKTLPPTVQTTISLQLNATKKEANVTSTVTTPISAPVTTQHAINGTLRPSSSEKPIQKPNRINDIKADEIIESYKQKVNSKMKDKIDRMKPLLEEYLKRTQNEKKSRTNDKLDKLDKGD